MILLMVDVTLLGCPKQFSDFQHHIGLSVTNCPIFMAFLPSKYICIGFNWSFICLLVFCNPHLQYTLNSNTQCPRIISLELISSGIFFLATASCSSFVLLFDKYSWCIFLQSWITFFDCFKSSFLTAFLAFVFFSFFMKSNPISREWFFGLTFNEMKAFG